MKRLISFMLVFVMVLGMMPVGEIVAFATSSPKVLSIEITTVHKELEGEEISVLNVIGENFTPDNLGVRVPNRKDPLQDMVPKQVSSNLIRYELKDKEFNGLIYIGSDSKPTDLREGIPTIDNVLGDEKKEQGVIYNSSKNDSDGNEDIILEGSSFLNINNANVTAEFIKDGKTSIKINAEAASNDKTIISKDLEKQTGVWDILIKNEKKIREDSINLSINEQYLNAITIIEDLDISEDLTMSPNIGPTGTTVTIKSKPNGLRPTDRLSVFFVSELKPTIKSFKKTNMGIKETYTRDPEGKKDDEFTVEVPSSLGTGKYYVYITNNIPEGNDPEGSINQRKDFKNNQFIVSSGDTKMKITDVIDGDNNGKGKAKGISGSEVKILGSYIGKISDSIFIPDSNSDFDITSQTNTQKLKVEYKPKDDSKNIGKYKEIEGGVEVKKIEREITVLMGQPATIIADPKVTEFSGTTANVRVIAPSVTLKEGEDLTTDVEVIVYSEITIDQKDSDGNYIVLKREEKSKLKDYFTFISNKYQPIVLKVIPPKINVDEEGKTSKKFTLTIEGDNFFKYQYTKDGRTYIKNPEIKIAGQENSNEWFENIRVLDLQGREIDGKENNTFGKKIKVDMKEGKGSLGIIGNQNLEIINPLRENSDNTVGRLSALGKIEFVSADEKKIPEIFSIVKGNPQPVEGGKEVKLIGRNFAKDAIVYVDGKEVNRERNEIGTELTFTAPKQNFPGTYEIMVFNEESGGLDTIEISYVRGSTDPKIVEFNPKKGSNGTEVYLTGNAIMGPTLQIGNINSKLDSFNFIGTRVLLRKTDTDEMQDMNEYNYKPGTQVIELKEYTSKDGDHVVRRKKENQELELSEYHSGIVFENEGTQGSKYYKIFYDAQNNQMKLSDGANDIYVIFYKDGIKAKNGSIEEKVIVDNEYLNIGTSLKLRMKTPYEVDLTSNKIIGNRVKIKDNNSLQFMVNLTSNDPNEDIQNGTYEVIIINPDMTASEPAKDKFEYVAQPESKPKISSIEHINEGSSEGGYNRTIIGSDFREGAKVFIGTKEIATKDVTFISKQEIVVIIPKYEGKDIDLSKDGRKNVPLTISNPDGGAASYDFIYVNPKSKPIIDSIVPNFGPLSGGTEVTIYEGKDFRFFEPYEGTIPEGHTDLRKSADREKLGGSAKDKAKPADWEKQLNILPTIYFGDKKAEIMRYDAEGKNSSTGKRSITVKAPKGTVGKVSVYLENNDFGVSNKVDFEYKKSNIGKIEIKPGTGTKQGNTTAEIRSTEKDKKDIFSASDIKIFNSNGRVEESTKQLVKFGNQDDLKMSNKNVNGNMNEVVNENSGRIVNNNANVKVGNLEVAYKNDGENETLNFKLEHANYDEAKKEFQDVIYEFEGIFPKGEEEVYLPIQVLKNKSETYKGFEMVKISKERFTIDGKLSNIDRITVERGYSPDALPKQNGEYIDLKVPSYYSVGKVNVAVINSDGSEASTEYIYTNPANNPIITDVFREGNPTTEAEKTSLKKVIKVDYKGGVKIHVKGKDFRKPSRIDIGGDISISGDDILHLPQVADRENYEELVFTMPQVPENYVGKEYSFIVTTPYDDKGNSYNSATTSSSDGEFKIYIEFTKGDTNPKITNIDPNRGPSSGGTKVTIEGEDFRQKDPANGLYEELRVYVGDREISKSGIQFVNSKKLIITTPPNKSGEVTIKVENPDGSIAQAESGKDKFTYISNPKITNIVDPDNGDVKMETISIDGGQAIKIVGNDFAKDAKVLFNPVIKKASENPELEGDRIFINGAEYILVSGTPGTDLKVVDDKNITVVTPKGELGTGGVIVINSDGAATQVYDIKYGIPEITYPQQVRATLIKDEYIRINWSKVTDKATEADGKVVQYEVYVVEGSSQQFIGSTATTGFVFKDLEPNTKYKFLVRAIGKYGSSKPIVASMSNEVITGSKAGPTDTDGELGEKTKEEKQGENANVVIGSDAFDKGREYTVDLTRGVLAGSKEVTISISAKVVINEKNKTIKVIGSDYVLSFSPNVFENSTLKSNIGRSDAGVRFKVMPVNENLNITDNSSTILSAKYLLDGKVFVGSSGDSIENLNGKMNLSLDYDSHMAQIRRMKSINLVKYDVYDKKFKSIAGNSEYGTANGDIDELGTYTIIGSRR